MGIEERLRAASLTERNQAILDAHHAGWSLRQIANIVGLTHAGVRKIIQKGTP